MSKPKNLKWSTKNSKLKKDGIISFNIPAGESKDGFKTCPMAGACKAVCYATQGAYRFKSAISLREYNLHKSQEDSFVRKAVADLKRFRADKVRIHDSGDFYDQEYLNKWIEIASQIPNKIFYAYTKSLHLDFSAMPENMHIIQSEGGLLDHKINKKKPHSRIFKAMENLIEAGYINGSESDMVAVNKTRDIGLVYHGGRNLTEAQEKHFS